tara:strand:- start:965 stop:2359 length:1395 start_codon:yes stop_codon:yes gene_type:complete
MKRANFLKSLIGVSAFLGSPFSSIANGSVDEIEDLISSMSGSSTGSMVGYADAPISKVKVGIIGLGNRGKTLLQMFDYLLENGNAEIVAVCDIQEENVDYSLNHLKDKQKNKPKTYGKDENSWEDLVQQDNIDLVLIATPWRWHTPMALKAMESGKHVACEVPISYTLEDCWKIVQTAERTKRHCIMIENCCYNAEELWIMNMIQEGVFGELTHAECAYNHDLRAHLLSQDYYQDQWRVKHHAKRNGNFYTTHGIGPVGFYMGIGRGDTFTRICSMSSQEASLSSTAKRLGSQFTDIACGDVNTSLIQTAKGKSIMIQFDVHTGRPYSRINQVIGTKAVHEGYPSRLFIDSEEPVFWGHEWLNKDDYQTYRNKYEHPMVSKLKNISEGFKQGHAGMDFVMIYRLIKCLNKGLPLDIDVYDSAMWSAITPLSELSVAKKSTSIEFPDFTGGKWKEERPLEVMRDI